MIDYQREEAARIRRLYQGRRDKGLCARCGKPPTPGMRQCATCRAYMAAAKSRHEAKETR